MTLARQRTAGSSRRNDDQTMPNKTPPIPGAMRSIEPGTHKHDLWSVWVPDCAARIREWVVLKGKRQLHAGWKPPVRCGATAKEKAAGFGARGEGQYREETPE